VRKLAVLENALMMLESGPMSLASEVAAAVEIGREYGWDELRILKTLLRNVGGNARRELVVFWGDALGLDPKDALRRARDAGEIPTTAPPPSLKAGTLPRIVRVDTSE
jgi:hypothetical protein